MGHCWSDSSQAGERFEVNKVLKQEGDPMFFKKEMNQDVMPEIERIKRVNMTDGLGREENNRSIVTIQY